MGTATEIFRRRLADGAHSIVTRFTGVHVISWLIRALPGKNSDNSHRAIFDNYSILCTPYKDKSNKRLSATNANVLAFLPSYITITIFVSSYVSALSFLLPAPIPSPGGDDQVVDFEDTKPGICRVYQLPT